MKWATQRKVFGKRLIDQPVIRFKLARMVIREIEKYLARKFWLKNVKVSAVESCQSWAEHITYQMNHMDYSEQSDKLAGPIALLKYQVSPGWCIGFLCTIDTNSFY